MNRLEIMCEDEWRFGREKKTYSRNPFSFSFCQDEDDEFDHFTDDEEFEGFDKERPGKGQSKEKPPDLKITKVGFHWCFLLQRPSHHVAVTCFNASDLESLSNDCQSLDQ